MTLRPWPWGCLCRSRGVKHRLASPTAFTLIELMFIVTILAILIALLLPSLSRAREQANRVKCAANLHHIGLSARAFAKDHNNAWPQVYRQPPPEGNPVVFPLLISQDSNLEATDTQWQTYGTPLSGFRRYGAADGIWKCPSTERDMLYLTYTPSEHGTLAQWGSFVWTSYIWVGGLDSSKVGQGRSNWGSLPPSVSDMDTDPTNKVLAADSVWYTGGSGYLWDAKHGKRYEINHPSRQDSRRPDFQNILYADGHVEGQGPGYYPVALNTYNNYSFKSSAEGGFFYWGRYPVYGAVSAPPLGTSDIPVAPSPGPTPAPTPAPQPSPPVVTPPPPPPPPGVDPIP